MKERNEERRTYLRKIISNYTQGKRITTGSTIEEREREKTIKLSILTISLNK